MVRRDVAHHATHTRPIGIVEREPAVHIEQAIDEEEVDERVVEGVKAIDERELHTLAAGLERRERTVRRQLVELDALPEPGLLKVVEPDATPQRCRALARVHHDVASPGHVFRGFADGERAATHGQPDLECGRGLGVADDTFKETRLIGEHV